MGQAAAISTTTTGRIHIWWICCLIFNQCAVDQGVRISAAAEVGGVAGNNGVAYDAKERASAVSREIVANDTIVQHGIISSTAIIISCTLAKNTRFRKRRRLIAADNAIVQNGIVSSTANGDGCIAGDGAIIQRALIHRATVQCTILNEHTI